MKKLITLFLAGIMALSFTPAQAQSQPRNIIEGNTTCSPGQDMYIHWRIYGDTAGLKLDSWSNWIIFQYSNWGWHKDRRLILEGGGAVYWYVKSVGNSYLDSAWGSCS